MASIDIFPLSFNGVQPPLNLLSNIFSVTKGQKNFSYPLDLGTNPTFAHAIQFSIHDYTYPGLEQVATSLKDFYKSTNVDLTNIKNGALEQIQNINIGSSGLLGAAQGFLQPQSYSKIQLSPALASISLYMPDSLTTSYDSNYETLQMTDTLGLAGLFANSASDEAFKDLFQGKVNLAGSQNAREIASRLTGLGAANIPNAGINGAELTTALRQAFKQIPNPQIQLAYKGINLREFQFQFIFTPISEKEAITVDNIIKKFVYYSVPDLTGDLDSGQYLTPPQIFKIQFVYTGQNNILGAVTDIFKNTMTNIVGSQLVQSFSSTATGSPAKLFSIQDCVLTNVDVDYAPNGWAAYGDGYPVQTRLTLQFKEMELVTKKLVDSDQWNNDNPGSAASDISNMQNELWKKAAASSSITPRNDFTAYATNTLSAGNVLGQNSLLK